MQFLYSYFFLCMNELSYLGPHFTSQRARLCLKIAISIFSRWIPDPAIDVETLGAHVARADASTVDRYLDDANR